jgi:hypothetical protein
MTFVPTASKNSASAVVVLYHACVVFPYSSIHPPHQGQLVVL